MTSRFGFLKPVARKGGKTEKSKDKENTKVPDCQEESSSAQLSGSTAANSPQENGVTNIDSDDTLEEEYSSNNNLAASNGKKKLEKTSNNLSKLADKLNASKSKQASQSGGPQPLKPAFRRRGSSNIAKLSTGSSKERSGASQIHGQTPYSKSPKPTAKQPTGKRTLTGGMIAQRGLPRFTGIPGAKGGAGARVGEEKAPASANETFEVLPADNSETAKDISRKEDTSSTAATSTAATSTAATNNVIRRPTPTGGIARSGIRPPSGVFTGNAAAAPRAETRMKPPTNVPFRRSKENLLKGSKEELRGTGAKGVAVRRVSGQETSQSKGGNPDNLKAPGTVTPRQKAPSKELQNMADKLISYSNKKLQRPLSMCSGSDRLEPKSAGQKAPRKSIGGSNLRAGNSSSLQDLSRRLSSSNQDVSQSRSRNGSLTSSGKKSSLDKLKGGSMNSLVCDNQDSARDKSLARKGSSEAAPRKVSNGLPQPRSRANSKTLSSTNSEFGIADASGQHFQSTPVHKGEGFGAQAAPGRQHPLCHAVNRDISAVFGDDNNEAEDDGKKGAHPAVRRIVNANDGDGKNRTFDAIDMLNSTYLKIEPNDNTFLIDNESPADDVAESAGNLLDLSQSTHEQALDSNSELVVPESDTPNPSLPDKTVDLGPVDLGPVEGELVFCKKDKDDSDLDGYCSDNFLMNESMPRFADSLVLNVTDEPDAEASLLSSTDKELPIPKSDKKPPPTEPRDIPVPKTASRTLELSESTRRHSSPFVTPSDSLSLGTRFRIPKEASIAETEDGNVLIDEATFRHCQNDVKILKTNLLRLKRILTETDIISPLVRQPSKFGTSPPVTPSKPVWLSRSFSDASSWLAKSQKAPDLLANKTDEDKVEDEIKNLKEKVFLLERENEELKHNLATNEYTIKLLQSQMESQEYAQQVELLTEEKQVLYLEIQELKKRLGVDQDSSLLSSECLNRSQSANKIKSEIVKGFYELPNE